MKFSLTTQRLLQWLIVVAAVAKLMTDQAYAVCIRPPDGLVGWWRGESISSGSTVDAYPYANNAVVNSVSTTTGKVGNAFLFNSDGDYVAAAASASLNVGIESGFSFGAWVRPDNVYLAPVIEWRKPQGCGVHLWVGVADGNPAEGAIHVNIKTSGVPGADRYISVPNSISANTWCFLFVTFDATTGVLKLYRNGTLLHSAATSAGSAETTGQFQIGYRNTDSGCGLGGTSFRGLIDEVCVFKRVLNECEVSALYVANSSGMCAPTQPIVVTNPLWSGSTFSLDVLGPNSHGITIESSDDNVTWNSYATPTIGSTKRYQMTFSTTGVSGKLFRVKSTSTGNCADDAVGFATRSKPVNKTYILASNPFDRTCNSLASHIPSGLPSGTVAIVYENPNSSTTTSSTFSGSSWGTSASLAPGTPFFLQSSSPLNLKLSGYFPKGTRVVQLPNTLDRARASWSPTAGVIANLGITPADQDDFYLWDVATQAYKVGSYVGGGGWIGDITNPTVGLLDGFFYYAYSPRNWSQTSAICP